MRSRHIRRARGWVCQVPMPHPVRLGPMTYQTRDYAVLQVETDEGLVGNAIGYTRGTPILGAIRTLLTSIAEEDVTRPAQLAELLRSRHLPAWPQFIRAASLLDICLWDIHAKGAGQPIHRCLGGQDQPAELMAVAGYFADVRSLDEVVAEAERFVTQGLRRIKVMLRANDLDADRTLLSALRDRLPTGTYLAVDCHAAFGDADGARTYLTELLPYDIAFVEDPFPTHDWRAYAQLSKQLVVPLAAGEDSVSLSAVHDLLPWIDILRPDATASGGLTWAIAAAQAAWSVGRQVIPHVFPHIHAAILTTAGGRGFAEVIPAEVGADPLATIVDLPAALRGGAWVPQNVTGTGIRLRDEAIAHFASEELRYE